MHATPCILLSQARIPASSSKRTLLALRGAKSKSATNRFQAIRSTHTQPGPHPPNAAAADQQASSSILVQAHPPTHHQSGTHTHHVEKAKRSFRLPLAVALTLSLAIVSGATITSIAAYGAYRINRSRQRWFTDSFVLTPESLRIAYKRVSFTTEDGVTLEGWFMEQTVKGRPSERIVLGCAPFLKDKSSLLAVARALWDTGHSVLLFDFRAFAPKQAPHETIGHLEVKDGRAALAWLRANKPPNAKVCF